MVSFNVDNDFMVEKPYTLDKIKDIIKLKFKI